LDIKARTIGVIPKNVTPPPAQKLKISGTSKQVYFEVNQT